MFSFFVFFSKKNIVKMKLRTFLKAFEVEKKVLNPSIPNLPALIYLRNTLDRNQSRFIYQFKRTN